MENMNEGFPFSPVRSGSLAFVINTSRPKCATTDRPMQQYTSDCTTKDDKTLSLMIYRCPTECLTSLENTSSKRSHPLRSLGEILSPPLSQPMNQRAPLFPFLLLIIWSSRHAWSPLEVLLGSRRLLRRLDAGSVSLDLGRLSGELLQHPRGRLERTGEVALGLLAVQVKLGGFRPRGMAGEIRLARRPKWSI